MRKTNLTSRSCQAHSIAEAFSASLPTPIEPRLLAEIGTQIDRCLNAEITTQAIASGLKAWTESDSFSPTQIPNFVHKANNKNSNHKSTAKALGYREAGQQLIEELGLQ
jgi:hypothetical protein